VHTTHDGGLETEERERPNLGREEVKYCGGSDVECHFPSVDSLDSWIIYFRLKLCCLVSWLLSFWL